ncbi:phosphotransferase [Streptomyces hintoniae]|uniref:phosphotransferase n=1 Tax=Streptomyces hintoniae TaxID=3075521 RepID=UPI003F68B05E
MHPDQLTVAPETVRALLHRQFPEWRDLPVRGVTGAGTANAVFRVGDRLAARFPLEPADVESTRHRLEAEADAARALVDGTRFATPEPIALGGPGAGYPLPWSVQTWLPGNVAADDDPGASFAFAGDLADLIEDLRAIDTQGRTFTGSGRGGDLRSHDAWMETCLRNSERLLDVPRLRRLWSALRELPRGTADDVTTHGDLIPGNLLVADGRLTGVLDVGGAGPADPSLDLVGAWSPGPPTPPSTSSARGTCWRPGRARRSATAWAATTSHGSGAGRGPSSRRWGWSGTTSRATRS